MTKEMIAPKKESEGYWNDSDTFESCPEMQDQLDDIAIEFLKKENPALLEIMKKAGLNVDESEAKED